MPSFHIVTRDAFRNRLYWLAGRAVFLWALLAAWILELPPGSARAGAVTEAPANPASTTVLLPDLRTLPPSGLRVELKAGNARELRLSNTIWNSGSGPLELLGARDSATEKSLVYQLITRSDGSIYERKVGEFVWHPTHDHWHMDGFAVYLLRSLRQNGSLGEVVSASDKISYCVMDTNVVDAANPNFPNRRRYYQCDRALQGLSAGWGDQYKSHLDGQSLDITDLPDGCYALESTVNPEASLFETNTNNNTAIVFLELKSDRVAEVPASELGEAGCIRNRTK